MKKKTFIIAISTVFAILIATFTSTYLLLFNKPFNVASPTFIYIDNDDSTDSVFTKIKSNLNPQSMTGLKVIEVNVHVQGVSTVNETAKNDTENTDN